ncbi:MAG: FkbM family methyltransferase [Rhodothermales bacterium]|nr:FkbM family methyltransferase [Rhodothermales bacterium]
MNAALSLRLRQMAQLAALVAEPGGLRALRTWKPFSLSSFQITRALHRQGFRFRTVVDGGANIGQFARAAAETWPDARVVSFEPLPDAAKTLRRNVDGRAEVVEAALGAVSGTTTFFRTDYTLASSVLRPDDPTATPLTVRLTTLDEELEALPIDRPLLLKLDLQGYELEALRGGKRVLGEADAVLLETPFRVSYDGEPLFREILAFMEDAGFIFLRPLDVWDDGHEIRQMDALFVRA